MDNFVKNKKVKLIAEVLKLRKEKNELFQQINNLKLTLPKKIKAIEEEFKTQQANLAQELAKEKISAKFYPQKIKIIEKKMNSKTKEIKEIKTKKIEEIKKDFKIKIENLEKKEKGKRKKWAN
ncbi:hypothetical protein [Spiroplasma endosymbiont of Polydrusus pterygomalis]|uniref:hypothetical protein n=1 Tax=Spiroplasma endosymbiont of Polydrusus pterygomalis TaxID=3139327 RepID=UPI003CCAFEE4